MEDNEAKAKLGQIVLFDSLGGQIELIESVSLNKSKQIKIGDVIVKRIKTNNSTWFTIISRKMANSDESKQINYLV